MGLSLMLSRIALAKNDDLIGLVFYSVIAESIQLVSGNSIVFREEITIEARFAETLCRALFDQERERFIRTRSRLNQPETHV